MADDTDKSQQTEEPTAKRLEQAREAGDIVKSAEINTLVLLGGGTLAIAVFGKSTALGIAHALTGFLEQPDAMGVDGDSLSAIIRMLLIQLGTACAPFFAALAAAAVAGHLIQGRPSFNADRLMPDFSKVSPIAGFKRMFGIEGWVNLLKGLCKIAIVGMAIWTQLWPERGTLEGILSQSTAQVAGDMSHLLFKVLIAALGALAVIAGADWFFQRMQWLSRKRMMAQVPTATVVIMNPTHYAVALKYESGKTAAPICVAKGMDALALKIRAVAEENDVPVIENPPLARALHAAIDIDEPVPAEHFKAVAQVIGYVMRLRGQIPARAN
jgi:flagellar biosynthetic protein FlhB